MSSPDSTRVVSRVEFAVPWFFGNTVMEPNVIEAAVRVLAGSESSRDPVADRIVDKLGRVTGEQFDSLLLLLKMAYENGELYARRRCCTVLGKHALNPVADERARAFALLSEFVSAGHSGNEILLEAAHYGDDAFELIRRASARRLTARSGTIRWYDYERLVAAAARSGLAALELVFDDASTLSGLNFPYREILKEAGPEVAARGPEVIPLLVRHLHGRYNIAGLCADFLVGFGADATPAVIESFANAPSDEVQKRVFRLLGRLGREDVRAVNMIWEYVTALPTQLVPTEKSEWDRDKPVWTVAIESLSHSAAASTGMVGEIKLHNWQEPTPFDDTVVRCETIAQECVELLSSERSPAIDANVRRELITLLGWIGTGETSGVTRDMAASLLDDDGHAALGASIVGRIVAACEDTLWVGRTEASAERVTAAVEALGNLIPKLTSLLRANDPAVRIAAALALGSFALSRRRHDVDLPDSYDEAYDALMERIADRSIGADELEALLVTLTTEPVLTEELVSTLREVYQNNTAPETRLAAIAAVKRCGKEAAPHFAELLFEDVLSSNEPVAKAAQEALAEIDPKGSHVTGV